MAASGILRLRLHEIKEHGLSRKKDAYVEVLLNDEPYFSSRKKPLSDVVSWEEGENVSFFSMFTLWSTHCNMLAAIDKFVPNLTTQKISVLFKLQKDKDSKPTEDEVVGFWAGDVTGLMGKYGETVEVRAGSPKSPGMGSVGKLKLSIGYAPVELDLEQGVGEGTNSEFCVLLALLEYLLILSVQAWECCMWIFLRPRTSKELTSEVCLRSA